MNIPKDKVWRGLFPGDYTGNLWMTRNIDLERSVNRLVLGDRFVIQNDANDTGFSNLTTINKFLLSNAADNHASNARWYAQCSSGTTGGRIFRTAAAADPTSSLSVVSTWEEDTSTGVPTDALDMETHESVNGEQRLLVTRQGDTAILNKSGGANAWDVDWGSTVASLSLTNTSGFYHPIARLQRLIAIGDGNLLHTIDKNDVVSASRLIFPYGYRIRNIYASSDRFWIGLTGFYGQNALVIEWDGFSLTWNNEYKLIGRIPLSGFIIDNIPYFITEVGLIFKYAGGSFKQVHQFPFAEERILANDTAIANYGCAVDRNLVYILLNCGQGTFLAQSKRTRGGIWVYNSENQNLYHRSSLSGTRADALTTDPDYGQSELSTVGGIHLAYDQNAVFTPIIAAGGTYFTAYTGTTKSALWRSMPNYGGNARAGSRGPNRGQFVTSYISTQNVDEMWQGIWPKFKRFVDSGNRIIVKGRVVDPATWATADVGTSQNQPLLKSGTWTATTTFTSVVPTGVVVGDEVEVTGGNGAGCTFHISTLSATPDNSTVITVTVDEAIPSLNASGSRGAMFRFDNWKKLGVISSTSEGHEKMTMPSSAIGEFIQFKLELRGYEVEIDELIPISKLETAPEML